MSTAPTLHTVRQMDDGRFEYNDLWRDAARDWVRVIRMPVSAREQVAVAVVLL